jgi:hypothetical protein
MVQDLLPQPENYQSINSLLILAFAFAQKRAQKLMFHKVKVVGEDKIIGECAAIIVISMLSGERAFCHSSAIKLFDRSLASQLRLYDFLHITYKSHEHISQIA